jgi:hypothetical protein
MEAKRNKLIVIIAVVVLLLGGGMYSGYAFFDMFKSNKTIYLEAEAKQMEKVSQSLDEYNKYLAPYLEGAVDQKMEVSNLNVDMEMPDQESKQVMGLVKDSKLVIESKSDVKSNINYGKVDVHVKNNNLIGVEFFYDNDKVGFGVPAIYNKYGYFNWKDKKVMEQKYGLTDLPEKVHSQKEYMELLQLKKEELQPILQEYAKLYADSIQDKQVSVNKNATFEENGTKVSAKEITVTFTPEEYKQLVKKFAAQISQDQKLHDFLYARYQKLAELMAAQGAGDEFPKLTKEEFKKKFSTLKEDVDREMKDAHLGDGVKMVVYVDKSDTILSRSIEVNDKKAGEKAVLKIATFQDKEQKDRTAVTLTVNEANGKEDKISVVYVTKKEGNKENQDVTIALDSKNDPDMPSMTLGWKGTVTANEKDKTRIADYKVELKGPQNDPTMPKNISFDLKSQEKFLNTGAVKLPELNAQNSINIATVNDQQMMQIQQEIQMGAMQFMQKNAQLFQELGIMPPMGAPAMQ